jgi:pimeloyl-ACP methyl ester carboxylesterase
MRTAAGSEAVAGLLRWPSSRRLLLRYAMEHGDRVPPDVAAGFFADTAASTAMDPLRAWAKGRRSIEPMPTHGARVRIAWPRHDRLIPWNRYGVPFRQISPGAELVFLEGVGHVPMYDDPELVVRTILTHTLDVAVEQRQ